MRTNRPVRRVQVPLPAERGGAALLRGIRIPGLAIATLVLLVFGVAVLAPQLSTYLNQRQQLADLKAKVASQRSDLASLNGQVARWSDPAYIRSQAGSRLFYVLPGETTYRVLGEADADAATARPSKTATTTKTDWAATLLGSLITAGTSTSSPGGLTTSGADR
jgi:cell division protein FtsB